MPAEHINNFDWAALSAFHQLVRTLESAGLSAHAANLKAQALTAHALDTQVSILSFLDAFWLLGLVALVGLPLAIFVRSATPAALVKR